MLDAVIKTKYLVLASRSSFFVSGLGVGCPRISGSFLLLHDGEAYIGALWVLVTVFTGVNSRCVGTVSFPGLVRVEVGGATWGVWVPGSVNIVFGLGTPQLIVVLSELEGKRSGGANTEGGWCESRGRGHKGSEGNSFSVLLEENKWKECKSD